MHSSQSLTLETLITQEAIAVRTAQLAEEIKADYGSKDLLFVGILKGSVIFLSDLIRHFPPENNIDFFLRLIWTF